MKALLHRHLWQRIPRSWRRQGLYAMTRALAPRPGRRGAQTALPLYIVGPLSSASGLGESARLCLASLTAAGIAAVGVDISRLLMQDTTLEGGYIPPAALPAGPGSLVVYANAPLMPLVLLALGRRRVKGKTIIGFWAWELPRFPAAWHIGLRFVHEVWVSTHFIREAIGPKPPVPVRVIPYPVPVPAAPPSGSPAQMGGGLRVLTMFNMRSGFSRKNPVAAIQAFLTAFGGQGPHRLTIKVTNGQDYPDGWRALRQAAYGHEAIEIIDEAMTPDAVAALVDSCDVMLALHRSEGFGLHLVEAMLRGKVVVATNWSGNVDFLSPENSRPVPYRLVPAHDPQGTYDDPSQLWAEPDIDAAAGHLRALVDPATRTALGARAQADAMRLFSSARFAGLVTAALGLRQGHDFGDGVG